VGDCLKIAQEETILNIQIGVLFNQIAKYGKKIPKTLGPNGARFGHILGIG
jgi:hypothetical protein